MQRKKPVSLVLLMFVSGGAFAAIGDGKAVVLEKPSQVHETAAKETQPRADAEAPAPKSQDTTNARATTSKACEQAADAAVLISEKFTQFSNEIVPQLVRTGEEFARQVEPTVRQLEPTMRDFAQRLQDLAKQMEQSLGERPSR